MELDRFQQKRLLKWSQKQRIEKYNALSLLGSAASIAVATSVYAAFLLTNTHTLWGLSVPGIGRFILFALALLFVPLFLVQSIRLYKKPLHNLSMYYKRDLPRLYRKTNLPDAPLQWATTVEARDLKVYITIRLYVPHWLDTEGDTLKKSPLGFPKWSDIRILISERDQPEGFGLSHWFFAKPGSKQAQIIPLTGYYPEDFELVGLKSEFKSTPIYCWHGDSQEAELQKQRADEWCVEEEEVFHNFLEEYKANFLKTKETVEEIKHY